MTTAPPSFKKGPIVILTGAGISAESGIATFRGADGLWENHEIEDVASPEGFARDPDLVQRFYNGRRTQLLSPQIKPNPAHNGLAKLEKMWPHSVTVVTQNIDDLHERAGSQNLLHMHGELLKVRCQNCQGILPWRENVTPQSSCTHCKNQESLRPHVVWFGEMPLFMTEIYTALGACELFLAIGTSSNVYPAAGFVEHVRQTSRAHTAELNLEPSSLNSLFKECIYGPASKVVPAYVERLLAPTIVI